jgi:hypothetical protein
MNGKIWLIWLGLFAASFAVLEGLALHSGTPTTFSDYVVWASSVWGPLPVVFGWVTGGLAVHFWWHWTPSAADTLINAMLLNTAILRLRAKLIEAIGYREPTPDEHAALDGISAAKSVTDAEAVFARVLKTLDGARAQTFFARAVPRTDV